MKNKIKQNLHSDFVERKLEIENEEQPTQENTVEKYGQEYNKNIQQYYKQI